MCLIIRCEKEKEITKEIMKGMYARNDDGYGFMWVQDNKIHGLKKSGGNIDELYDKYQELKEYNPFIHLRMRTHGEINDENAHPYFCGYGIWLMHNGVIHHSSIKQQDKKSDTWQFVDNVLNPLFKNSKNPHQLIRSDMFRNVVEHFLGSGNRVVIGDRGGFVLMNEKTWYTVPEYVPGLEGLLVSNSYAWSPDSYNPKKNTSSWGGTGTVHYGYQSGSASSSRQSNGSPSNTCLPVSPVSSTDSNRFSSYQTSNSNLRLISGKYWTDPFGGMWSFNGYGYVRRRDLDDITETEIKALEVVHKGDIPFQVQPAYHAVDAAKAANDAIVKAALASGGVVLATPTEEETRAVNQSRLDVSSGEDVRVNDATPIEIIPPFDNSTESILILPYGENDNGEHNVKEQVDDAGNVTLVVSDSGEEVSLEDFMAGDVLCRRWAEFPEEDMVALMWTEPEETIKVLQHALRRYK